MEKLVHADTKQEKAGEDTLKFNNVDFKSGITGRNNEGSYMMMKGTIYKKI